MKVLNHCKYRPNTCSIDQMSQDIAGPSLTSIFREYLCWNEVFEWTFPLRWYYYWLAGHNKAWFKCDCWSIPYPTKHCLPWWLFHITNCNNACAFAVDDNYEDPDDVAAIQEAQNNMGDYKLKTADDYVVPDHLRMNVEKAIMKLLILKEMVSDDSSVL